MDSVQNALIISFLVKENLISIEDGTDGLPHVTVNTVQQVSTMDDSNQAICRLDVELCQVRTSIQNYKAYITNIFLLFYRNMPSIIISRNLC